MCKIYQHGISHIEKCLKHLNSIFHEWREIARLYISIEQKKIAEMANVKEYNEKKEKKLFRVKRSSNVMNDLCVM